MSLFKGKLTPFSSKLKYTRVRLNLTHLEVAKKLGITVDQYLLYERGEARMPDYLISKTARLLHAPELEIKSIYSGGRTKRI